MNTETIRCFIAVKLPGDIKHQIESYVQELVQFTKGVRWVNTNNLHLTLKFLGEVEKRKVEKIKHMLEGVNQVGSSFDLSLIGWGCFPARKRPRVFWLGFDKGALSHLHDVHNWLDKQLYAIGFEKESRKFSPHLTIGRVKGDEDFSKLFHYLDTHPFGSTEFKVDTISLIRSVLKPHGAVYTTLGAFSL
jgi:2'-5' RNA ligase